MSSGWYCPLCETVYNPNVKTCDKEHVNQDSKPNMIDDLLRRANDRLTQVVDADVKSGDESEARDAQEPRSDPEKLIAKLHREGWSYARIRGQYFPKWTLGRIIAATNRNK